MKQVLVDRNNLPVIFLKALNSFSFVSLNFSVQHFLIFRQLLNDHEVLLIVVLESMVGILQLIVDVLEHLQLLPGVIHGRLVFSLAHYRNLGADTRILQIIVVHILEQMGVLDPASRHNIEDHDDGHALLRELELVLDSQVADVVGHVYGETLLDLLLGVH